MSSCSYCKQEHDIARCPKFRAMKAVDRYIFVVKNEMCKNCLVKGHASDNCPIDICCPTDFCGKKHNKLLHLGVLLSECFYCEQKHSIFQCPWFLALTVLERRKYLLENNRCWICLVEGHIAGTCIVDFRCPSYGCGLKHNRILHLGPIRYAPKASEATHEDAAIKQTKCGYIMTYLKHRDIWSLHPGPNAPCAFTLHVMNIS